MATVVGLLAPPGLPAKIAQEVADGRLEALLAERDGGAGWDVRFCSEVRAHDAKDDDELVDVAREVGEREGWDVALSLTDLPLDAGRRPTVADAYARDRVGIVSLPALGGIRRQRRTAKVMARLAVHLTGGRDEDGGFTRPVEPDDERVDLRLAAPPVVGPVMLLNGMLRANRPWRVVLGLSRALVVALSTAAFAMITNTIWQLGEALGVLRLAIFTAIALTAMVAWLIVDNDLWERPGEGLGRAQARLFNTATVLTLAIGAVCFYGALLALSLAAAAFLLERGVVESAVGHPIDTFAYFEIAWFTASLATIGGTFGSGLEDKVEVREAAYSYHPERRSES